jgi:uncharacterized protein Usg
MSLALQIEGYRLTTPKFPVLHKFLDFWTRQLDGKLHSVRVGAASLITPGEWRHTEHLRYLN